jgi:hypothetical protein
LLLPPAALLAASQFRFEKRERGFC